MASTNIDVGSNGAAISDTIKLEQNSSIALSLENRDTFASTSHASLLMRLLLFPHRISKGHPSTLLPRCVCVCVIHTSVPFLNAAF